MKIALPNGCRGIDDPATGRTYRPKSLRSGVVEINDNPAFARAAKHQLGEVGTTLFMSASWPTWSCGCGRTNWESDKVCRRCGKERS